MQEYVDLQERIRAANEAKGKLRYYDCPICNNKGYVVVEADGGEIARECECMAKRANLRRLKKSGLMDLAESYTFDTFECEKPWQSEIKAKAMEFIDNDAVKWFVVTGNAGTGKTHICTAIVTSLINKGKDARYMLWREVAPRLKALINERDDYEAELNALKRVDVLYIDDFLKGTVTEADINLAFDLINARYNARKKITILSSERTIQEIIAIDEAMGSRINERSKGYRMAIQSKENYRLKE